MSDQMLLTKRKKEKSPALPPVWIDKDFWFQSFPFPPSPLLFHIFLSVPPLFHSVYFWHRKTGREGEREAFARKITEEERTRERDSFGVKGEVTVSSFLLSDWPVVWSLDLGPSQRGRAVCHFDGGAGRGGARAGRRGAGGGTDAAGRRERGGLGGFGYGGTEQSSGGVLAHVEEGRVVEEE